MLHGIIILFFFSSSLALVSGRDCSAPPSRQGRCRAAFVRFTYEQGVCREFTYGGCGASNNLFVTLEECQAFCSGIRVRDKLAQTRENCSSTFEKGGNRG